MKSKNYSENIIKVFKKDGFVLSEPDVLLDSDYIIQRSGENFRKLMLTFEDDTGKNMCLRPDLTVASCIKYLRDNFWKNNKEIENTGPVVICVFDEKQIAQYNKLLLLLRSSILTELSLPLLRFFKVAFPDFISSSPYKITAGDPILFAYSICFFNLPSPT